ncbi:MAG: hypothetical protein H6Q89_2513 [Myxococcaceae bacterium]|nr:hypothetical protein [Myxococcaceae bacterium]
MSNLALKQQLTQHHGNGGRLVAADGRTLPLKAASLTADAKGGIIRVVLEQRFVNPYREPLQVTYQMALPAEGAVSGFAFRIGEERIVGEVDTKKKARDRFEEAILDGRTAAILDQERSSLFTQQVGNIPPQTEVVAELTIDQKLLWLPDGAWEWRFPTVVAPRYLGGPGRVIDAAAVTVDVADQQLPVKLSLKMSVRDQIAVKPFSPSHPLHAAQGIGRYDVSFGDESGVALDRDVVVRWQAAGLMVGAELDVARPVTGEPSDSAFGLITLVPPTPAARMESVPRDLIVLLDTSGSMGGQPLDQARRVVSAMIDTLQERDRLELIEFSNEPRRWKRSAQEASPRAKAEAQAWLAALRAGGGTEMASGMIEALKSLRKDAQRQVVLITDGLIGSEHEVLDAILHKLPAGSRVHTVGVGSAVNRSLTMPAARAGRGVEIVIGLGEDAEVAARRLLARTTAPLVTEVEVSGSAVIAIAPEHPMDLFAGSPALLSVKLNPAGGELVVRGKTAEGNYLERLTVKPLNRGEGSAAIATLFGRECVEDLETRAAAGEGRGEIDRQVERLGIGFQISTRLTSWVAVSKSQTVDPTAPRRQEKIPQNLPFGMSAEGLGLRGAPAQAVAVGGVARRSVTGAYPAAPAAPRGAGGMPPPASKSIVQRIADFASDALSGSDDEDAGPPAEAEAPEPVRSEEAARAAPKRMRAPALDEKAKEKKEVAEQDEGGLAQGFSARLVLLKDGRMAVEFSFAGGTLVWAPMDVVIELADGSFVTAEVDAARTTTPHTAQAGVTLTLALKVPVGMGQPVKVHLKSGNVPLLLEL